MTRQKPLVLTMGEPAGIGPEITAAAWQRRAEKKLPPFFVVGDPSLYEIPVSEIEDPAQAIDLFKQALPVFPLKLKGKNKPGVLNPENAPCVIESIEKAVSFVQEGKASGIVTNPIHKNILHEAGFEFPGHTEFLAHLCGNHHQPVMMLMAKNLRVVPLTIHVPLAGVPGVISKQSIIEKAKIILSSLQTDFGLKAPRLAVAGLNPHAGESGQFGREEIEIISPAIETLKKDGHKVSGPYSADTMFHDEARAEYDAVLCMYHDQALIPVKTLDFHGGVNITLGLPIIRTSPDHGTALEIAGKGVARPDSLMTALLKAAEIVGYRAY